MPSRLSLTPRGRALVGLVVVGVVAGAAWMVADRGDPAPGPATTTEPDAPDTEEATAPPVVDAALELRTPTSGDRAIAADAEGAVAAALELLVASAPVVVVADGPVEDAGRRVAAELGVPVLPASTPDLPDVLDRVDTRVVVHVTPAASAPGDGASTTPTPSPSAASTPSIAVGDREVRTVPVDDGAIDRGSLDLLRPGVPPDDTDSLLLVPADDPARAALASLARATGAGLLPVEDALVASPAAISRLQERDDAPWVAVGTRSAWSGRQPDLLAWDVEVVRRGVELPGGGYRLFPGRRLVALYGSPGAPSLGVLGEQPLDAAIERARTRASDYDELVDEPVVPTFEIISTVATAGAGSDGDYSREIPVDQLRSWIERTADEDMYVILDLQPGRTDFLTQARRYEELLSHPHVGLALDPEWRLSPDQRHLEQIGSVDVDEVQQVADWLAELTRRERLPQKLLLLHQFRLSMLPGRDSLQVPPELAVTVQMDGQGPQEVKMATWRAITDPASEDLWFGWKNFYDEDTTLRSPADTFGVEPSPVLVSYQ